MSTNAAVTHATIVEVNPDDRSTTVEAALTCPCGFEGESTGVDTTAAVTTLTVTVECPGCWTTHEKLPVR